MWRTLAVVVLAAPAAVAQPGGALAGGAAAAAQTITLERLATAAATAERAERWPEAVAARERVLAVRAAIHGPTDWRVTDARSASEHARHLHALTADQRARLRQADDDIAAAERAYLENRPADITAPAERSLATRRTILGDGHRLVADAWTTAALGRAGGPAEAAHRAALSIRLTVLGGDHPDTARTRLSLGTLLAESNRGADARPLLHEAVRVLRTTQAPGHPLTRQGLLGLLQITPASDNAGSAVILEQIAAEQRQTSPFDPVDLANTLYRLGQTRVRQGRQADAVPPLVEAAGLFRNLPADHAKPLARVLRLLGE